MLEIHAIVSIVSAEIVPNEYGVVVPSSTLRTCDQSPDVSEMKVSLRQVFRCTIWPAAVFTTSSPGTIRASSIWKGRWLFASQLGYQR